MCEIVPCIMFHCIYPILTVYYLSFVVSTSCRQTSQTDLGNQLYVIYLMYDESPSSQRLFISTLKRVFVTILLNATVTDVFNVIHNNYHKSYVQNNAR